MKELLKRNKPDLVIKLIVIIVILILLLFITIQAISDNVKYQNSTNLLSTAYAAWNMDDKHGNDIKDYKGAHNAIAANTKPVNRLFGRARYFNGKDSYIETPVNFKGWRAVTISLWVKPEKKSDDTLSVILDNGHDVNSNFVIQSVGIEDKNNGKWVWHCNGKDITIKLLFNRWTHLIIVADIKKGVSRVYVDERFAGEINTGEGLEFGAAPLTIGKLARENNRYFQGSIDNVIVLDKAIDNL